jgi:hypothetical protein
MGTAALARKERGSGPGDQNWVFVIANDQIAKAGKRSPVGEVVVGRPGTAEDMNICTGKFDIWSSYPISGFGSTVTKAPSLSALLCSTLAN